MNKLYVLGVVLILGNCLLQIESMYVKHPGNKWGKNPHGHGDVAAHSNQTQNRNHTGVNHKNDNHDSNGSSSEELKKVLTQMIKGHNLNSAAEVHVKKWNKSNGSHEGRKNKWNKSVKKHKKNKKDSSSEESSSESNESSEQLKHFIRKMMKKNRKSENHKMWHKKMWHKKMQHKYRKHGSSSSSSSEESSEERHKSHHKKMKKYKKNKSESSSSESQENMSSEELLKAIKSMHLNGCKNQTTQQHNNSQHVAKPEIMPNLLAGPNAVVANNAVLPAVANPVAIEVVPKVVALDIPVTSPMVAPAVVSEVPAPISVVDPIPGDAETNAAPAVIAA